MIHLCLHGVGTPVRPLEPGEDQYWIKEDQLLDIVDYVRRAQTPVLLSFDDGNASDFDTALPILQRFGVTAQFFVVAGRVGQPGWLDAEALRALVREGMTIGNHGMWHRPWRKLNAHELHVELDDARDQIAQIVGREITTAAFPYGSYDRRLLTELRRRRYSTVYSVDGGARPARGWLQTRHAITRFDSAETVNGSS